MTARVSAIFVTGVVLAGAAPSGQAGSGDPLKAVVADQFIGTDGELLYQTVCQACHMDDGRGATGAGTYPSLRNNATLSAAAYPIFMIVNGRRGMPALGRYLSDGQVAAITNYIRSNFGNSYRDKVSTRDVAAFRPRAEIK